MVKVPTSSCRGDLAVAMGNDRSATKVADWRGTASVRGGCNEKDIQLTLSGMASSLWDIWIKEGGDGGADLVLLTAGGLKGKEPESFQCW